MTRAIIDIGTNTAHIIIARIENNTVKDVLYKKRCYTFLGEEGLDFINPQVLSRLWKAMDEFALVLREHSCKSVLVIATEGLRSASNGAQIERHIKNHYGFEIRVVSGLEEAELIFLGASQAVDLTKAHYVIMDIGGGSCEFVWVSRGKVVWSGSYPIGISRLFNDFHLEDPISTANIELMKDSLDVTLSQMWNDQLIKYPNPILVGCAGTFEIFLDKEAEDYDDNRYCVIPRSRLTNLLTNVRGKDSKDRARVEGIPKERAAYIVVALELMNYVCERLHSESFLVSKYALKEGALVMEKYFFD